LAAAGEEAAADAGDAADIDAADIGSFLFSGI
jgi:hypothetical protein